MHLFILSLLSRRKILFVKRLVEFSFVQAGYVPAAKRDLYLAGETNLGQHKMSKYSMCSSVVVESQSVPGYGQREAEFGRERIEESWMEEVKALGPYQLELLATMTYMALLFTR